MSNDYFFIFLWLCWHPCTQIRRYAERCSCLLAIDACILTKKNFLLSRTSTKKDCCGATGQSWPWQLVSGSSHGNRDRIDGGSSGHRVAETPAVASEETSGQQLRQQLAMKNTARAGHCVVVNNGKWYDNNNHDNNNSSCYDEDNYDNDRRNGGGSGGAENRAGGSGGGRGRSNGRALGRGQRWEWRLGFRLVPHILLGDYLAQSRAMFLVNAYLGISRCLASTQTFTRRNLIRLPSPTRINSWYCHSVILSFCHSVILSFRHSVILSFCHSVILSFCHSVCDNCHNLFYVGIIQNNTRKKVPIAFVGWFVE